MTHSSLYLQIQYFTKFSLSGQKANNVDVNISLLALTKNLIICYVAPESL